LRLRHPSPPSFSILSLHDALPISRLCQAWLGKSEPRFGVQTGPVGGSAAALASAPQCLLPELLDPPSHCAEFLGAEPQAEVLVRSEEHTSELQSRGHLVCRLLLEK